MILSADGISKSYGANVILKTTDLKIENNDRIGLVGINGAGKSTLLNLLTGLEQPDTGEIYTANQASIGFLQQNSGLDSENTLWNEMLRVFAPLLAVQAELRTLEKKLSCIDAIQERVAFDALTKQYATQSEWFEKHDGYLIDVKIKTILNGMGFSEKPYDTIVQTLSGGEKTRLAMAKLLLEGPSLLVLDEPTNHLDFKTLLWLEDYLGSYRGAILVISHDRYFLDKLVTSIWELERNELTRYKGNYTKYTGLKAEAAIRYQKEYEMQQEQIAAMEDYVARNLVRATTSKSAKSRIAALERMDVLERPKGELKPAHLTFDYEREPVKDVLDVTELELAVGKDETQKVLCNGINLHVFRGEKIAIVGSNGIGKSTFLKEIQEILPHRHGRIEWGRNVKIGYYEQENHGLHPEKTALNELWDRYPRLSAQQIRSVLGAVLLTGEDVYKQVSVLSGGEKAKLSFAILMLHHANTLILDEPTNHLDLPSKEVLEKSLMEFTGTLLMVSHDRYMLNKVPDKIVEFVDDGIRIYVGKYDDYLLKTQQEQQALQVEPPKAQPKPALVPGGYRSREQRSQEAQRKQRVRDLEELIATAEAQISALEEELTREEVFSDYKRMTEKCAELEKAKEQLSAYSDEWLELEE